MHAICIIDVCTSNLIRPKARANLHKHRVSFADAEQALRDPFAVTIDDPDHTSRGNRVRLISARKASKGEAEQYHA